MIQTAKYSITTTNVLRHEWLGLSCRVVDSSDKTRIGRSGIVVDETMKTLVLATPQNRFVVPKAECVFAFDLAGETAVVDGKRACVPSVERLRVSGGKNTKEWLA